jgi:molybdopterin-containing oxidoreductase family membrane subunit
MIGLPLAIMIPVCSGSLFGVVGARPYWHSAIFPVMFLFEALLSGVSLITLLGIIFGFSKQDDEGLFNILPRLILGLLVVNITLELSVMAVPLWGQVAYHIEAVKLVLFGPFWWVFWLVHMGLGSIIPLLLLFFKPNSARLAFASGLIALTFMSVRLNIVIPALAIPELKGLESAFIEKRLIFSYCPSFHEWQVSLFMVSLAIGLFYLGMQLLYVLETKRKK